MTQFEFVQVTVAIILGLGLTDILRGLGEQFRSRSEIEVAWLQVGASCLLLLVILTYLWGFWIASEVTWTLPLFMMQVASAIALALSAQFIKVDLSSGKTLEAQYFDNGTGTFVLWAMAPLFALFFSFATGNVVGTDAVRIGAAILLVSLGLIKSRIYHAVVLVVLLLAATVAFPALVLFELR